MNQSTPIVSIHPYWQVHPGKLEEFKAAIPAFIDKSRHEPQSLYYELTANGDEYFCREGYVGAEGVLAHLANIGPMLPVLLNLSDLTRLEVHGPAAELEKLKGPLADLKPTWFTTAFGVGRTLTSTLLNSPVTRDLGNPRGARVPEDAIAKFAAAFRGHVIRPGDADYDSARKIWNASIDKRPGLIARCAGVADVVAAVKFAREHDLLVAVRSGGHNVGGRALCDGGLVIDFSRMKGIHVDAKNRRARVQAGATLGDVDRETHVFGLAAAAGVVSKTGIAGLTLGGGVGWLVRKYGMACDNVVSFDVVTADGTTVVASSDENPDLYWGLRGGGGNFGVVTSFEFRLHPVNLVLAGLIIYPRSEATEVLRFYRNFTQAAPEELTAYAVLMHTPDGAPVVAVAGCYCGDLAEGEKVLKPLRAFGKPLVDAFQPMPFPVMQSLFDGAFPDGNQNYWKSAFLRELSDEAIDVLVEHANVATSPLSAVLVEYYGGAASRVGVAETAFAQRQMEYSLVIAGQWTVPAESPRHIAWTRGLATAMERFGSGAFLLNALGEEGDDAIKAAFGPNYARLAALKQKYDPTNFFRLNHNVRPAG